MIKIVAREGKAVNQTISLRLGLDDHGTCLQLVLERDIPQLLKQLEPLLPRPGV